MTRFVEAVTRHAVMTPMSSLCKEAPPAEVYPRIRLIEGNTQVRGRESRKMIEALLLIVNGNS